MGVDTERFVDNLPQEALCSLCCLILKEPVCSPCGHYICSTCWDSWRRGPSGEVCPYCYEKISTNESVERSQTVWQLLLNFNVHCPYHKEGCTAIYKLGLEDLHLQICPYNIDNNGCQKGYLDECESIDGKKSSNNCRRCQHTIDYSNAHDCIALLQKTVRTQKTQITNLEYENDRLSLRLTTKENGIMDQLIDVENRLQQEALNYELEIRELRTITAALEGELRNRAGETEEVDLTVMLERQNGSLGLNIIGGDREGKHSSGIFISRIAEGGPAGKPGKLQLNDRVLEVNEFDLRNASHEDAVHAFKNSHGAVRMLVRRSVAVDKKRFNVATQTESGLLKSCDLTDSALMSGSEAEESLISISENVKTSEPTKADFYDSAYDTLMTQKSSRSHRTYSLDESVSPVKESRDGSSESCDDVRTITPSTVVNGYGNGSQSSKIHSSSPMCGSASPDNDQSPVHEVKLRRNGNGDNASPRKVIRRSTYFLVDESIDGSFSSIMNSLSGESKVSEENNSTVTSISNDLDVEYEYEYEEVILKRTSSHFGISLCYGGDEDGLGVYIGKVEPHTAADKNGRVFVGDQVIQMNNAQVRCVEEASKMLRQNENLKLLLARPVHDDQLVNGFKSDFDGSQLSSLRETDNETESKIDSYQGTSTLKQGDTTPNKFSGMAAGQQEVSSSACSENKTSKSGCFESGFESMVDCNKNVESSKKIEKKSEIKDDVKLTLKDYVLSRLRGQDKGRNKGQESDYSSQSELSRERTLERKSRKETDCETPKLNKKDCCKDSLNRKEKHGASGSSSNGSARVSDVVGSPLRQIKLESPVRSAMKKESSSNKSTKHVRVDTKTDWTVTEKRIWEEFKIIQNMEAEEGKGQSGVEAEWKVRRSKDGKHIYIRKQSNKPNKSRFLKERAERLCAERTGITTDDDANTVYLGKFWNKDERKRQLLRHRLKREKLLERQIAKNSTPPNPMDTVMADIVQKRMTAPGHVFDDFLTVEEILAQRNKDGFLQGPIHVTTV